LQQEYTSVKLSNIEEDCKTSVGTNMDLSLPEISFLIADDVNESIDISLPDIRNKSIDISLPEIRNESIDQSSETDRNIPNKP